MAQMLMLLPTVLFWFLVLFERLSGNSLWEMLRKYFSRSILRHGENYERKMRKLAPHTQSSMGIVES